MVHISVRTERKSARNSSEDNKVREVGREGPSGAGAQIPLHSTEKNTFEQVFPAADGGPYHSTCPHCGTMEVHPSQQVRIVESSNGLGWKEPERSFSSNLSALGRDTSH